MSAEELLRASGLTIPDGHSIVSLAERPDLIDPSDEFNGSVWPAYMLGTPVANGQFGRCFQDWPQVQFVLLDGNGEIVATNNAMPLVWDGTDNGGRPVSRGVYFTQVRYRNSAFSDAKKLTVLK